MSTTRQHPPGDLGPEPDGIASASDASVAPAPVAAAEVPASGGPVAAETALSAASAASAAADAAAAADASVVSVAAADDGSVTSTAPAADGSVSAATPPATAASPSAGIPVGFTAAASPGASGGSSAQASAETGTARPAASPGPGTSGGSGLSAAGQVRSLPLHGASGIVPLARDFTRQALYDWGWLPASTADRRAAAEDVLLVVSELVTNACLHAEGPESLRVASDGKVLRLEVSDRSGGEPAPRTPHRAGRPGGHGMFIVQRLCLDWGVARTPEGAGQNAGKTVWAELAAPA